MQAGFASVRDVGGLVLGGHRNALAIDIVAVMLDAGFGGNVDASRKIEGPVGDEKPAGRQELLDDGRHVAREMFVAHLVARTDVGMDQDRPEILRIDDLRAARHLEHVVAECGSERDEARAQGRADAHPFVGAEELIVTKHSRVRMELAALGEHHEVATPLAVDEQDAVTEVLAAVGRSAEYGLRDPMLIVVG